MPTHAALCLASHTPLPKIFPRSLSRMLHLCVPLAVYALGGAASARAADRFVDLKPPENPGAPLGSIKHPYPTLSGAVTAASPGDTIQIRGGAYVHPNDHTRSFVTITTSGTQQAPITIQNYNGEKVTLYGHGFEDRDLTGDGQADGPIGTTNEALISIQADHIHVKGLELTNSNRWGMVLKGNHNFVDHVLIHDNWDVGLLVDGSNNSIQHVEAHHERHGSGLTVRPTALERLDDNVIAHSFFHDNGYQSNGVKVLPALGDSAGGGNSDGITGFKGCVNSVAAGGNLCARNALIGNVLLHNADDGMDISFIDSLVKHNISMDCCAPGDGPNGFKVFLGTRNLVYVNNISYHNSSGFSLRVHNVTLVNNLAIDDQGGGIWLAYPTDAVSVKNNLDAQGNLTKMMAIQPCATSVCSHNMVLNNNLTQQFVNPSNFKDSTGQLVVPLPPSMSIDQKVEYLQHTIRNAFSLRPGSAAKGAGTPVSYVDPTTGRTETIPFVGPAPDIGSIATLF